MRDQLIKNFKRCWVLAITLIADLWKDRYIGAINRWLDAHASGPIHGAASWIVNRPFALTIGGACIFVATLIGHAFLVTKTRDGAKGADLDKPQTATGSEGSAKSKPLLQDAPERIATLKEYFESGWPDLAGYYNVETLTAATYAVQIPWRINGDFAAMSKFLELYFGPTEPPIAVVGACVYIASNYRHFLTFPDSLIDIKAQWPGDTSVTHFRDMVFSNRVFIYYENFSLDQKAALESVYKSKGLAAQFRGAEYTVIHRYDHPPFRDKPLVPNAVLVPKAGDDGMRITFTNLKEGQKMVIPLNDGIRLQ